jgi:tetratricopeptide (TPR) repeat protein
VDEGVAFERAGLPDSALAAYRRAAGRGTVWKPIGDACGLAPSLKRLGELYEEREDRQRALEYCGRFVELWKDADPTLQPAVRDVRARMGQLAGERH